MKAILQAYFLVPVLLLASVVLADSEYQYRSPDALVEAVRQIASQNKTMASIIQLGQSYGGRDLLLLNLGRSDAELPAILVVANMEANYPMASEAAVRLAEMLLGDWREELDTHRWYIIPVGNPDGYARFFNRLKYDNCGNGRPINNDNDDAVDEDGPDDLNGDGYITLMRQKYPEGEWIPVEDNPVLMRKAETVKGEEGIYRLLSEGLDDDGDGEINEDHSGGANPGHNFPHDFQHYTATDGQWPASEPESRAILRFAFDHPEIAMAIILGCSNSLKNVPEGPKEQARQQARHKIRGWMAEETSLDPSKEYSLDFLVEIFREVFANPNLTEDMLLQWLAGEAATLPDKRDLQYWTEIGKRYEEFLEEAGLGAKRLSPPGFSNGSIDEWAYYQYGVPTFSLDFWTVPLPEEETGDDARKEGEESQNREVKKKIDEKPPEPGAKPSKDANEVGFREKVLYEYNPGAFVSWEKYDHPGLGEVEIGGMKPYAMVLPPAGEVDELIEKQLPFLRKLAAMLPQVYVEKVDIEKAGQGVWRVEAWIGNRGFLPYPTYQGRRCQRPTPAIAILEGPSGLKFLEDRQRQVLGLLEGSGGVRKIKWLVAAKSGTTLTVKVQSNSAGSDTENITVK